MSTMMWPRYPSGLPLASMVELSTQLSCDRDASVNISIMLTWVWWLRLEVALPPDMPCSHPASVLVQVG